MADEATMSYNAVWGGTIPFPENAWNDWYDHWLVHHDNKRFYRYLRDSETKSFIGEIAYHYDEKRKIWLADVIVASEYRGKGYGSAGLQLLCDAANANGVDVLRDDIAVDNPAIGLFLKAGFTEEYRTHEIIMLKKDLKQRPRRIIVIGSPGSGKSTFARKLRDKTGLPLYYLDMIFHWMRSRETLEFLGLWETLHNPDLNPSNSTGLGRKQASMHLRCRHQNG